MINICPSCKGIIGKETVCPKCGINIIDFKEELESQSAEAPVDTATSPNDIGNENIVTVHPNNQAVFATGSSLVKCPECGRDRVSSSAAMCPGCGFAVKDYFDRVRCELERETQMAAQEEIRKRRQEEYVARKQQRRKRLFGAPAKKALWISVGSIVLGLCVVLGLYIHKEKEISEHIEYAEMWFDNIKEDVVKLQDELENFDRVSDHEPTILEKEEMEAIEKLVKDISYGRDRIDYHIEFDERIAISLNSHIKWKTSYNSWDDYNKFLENKYLVSNTPENSAAQLIKARTYSSYEELWAAKRSKSLFVDSVRLSSNSSYDIVSGSVTNNTSSTVKFVVVTISLKDENGKVFDSDTAYACGEEGIRPGASAKFECHFTKDERTDSCTVSILRYD